MTCIGQQDAGKIDSSGCPIDRTFKALCHEPRQIAGVVDMRMSENDRIHRLGINRGIFPVSQSQFLKTLKQATVQKDPAVLRLDQEFGTCDSLCRAKKSQLPSRLGYVSLVPSTFTNFVRVWFSTFVGLKMCPTQ